MSIEFRDRIPPVIDYSDLLNYGICCQNGDTIESKNYIECGASGGYFIPGNPETIVCPDDHV